MKFTIEIDESRIEKAVQKAGKLDNWQMEMIARQVVEKKVAAEMRKRIGKSNDQLIEKLIDEVDWNEIVKEMIKRKLQENG